MGRLDSSGQIRQSVKLGPMLAQKCAECGQVWANSGQHWAKLGPTSAEFRSMLMGLHPSFTKFVLGSAGVSGQLRPIDFGITPERKLKDGSVGGSVKSDFGPSLETIGQVRPKAAPNRPSFRPHRGDFDRECADVAATSAAFAATATALSGVDRMRGRVRDTSGKVGQKHAR